MNVDLRFPIGVLFMILGGLLILFGAFTGGDLYQRSFNINVNLWWGFLMFLFGFAFFVLARAHAVRASREQVKADSGKAK
jgi:hypothetical protein